MRRRDLEDAEQMHLITVEHSGSMLMARLANPLFGEVRRATLGELYPARIRGRLAQRLAWEVDADMHATVRRALLTLESDLSPDPDLFLLAARFAMTLLDLKLADRFAAAAAQAGAAEAVGLRAMNLVLLGRGHQAEEVLQQISGNERPDGRRWSTVRAGSISSSAQAIGSKVWTAAPSHPAQVAMVAAASRSPWSAAHRNAVRRLASSIVNQS